MEKNVNSVSDLQPIKFGWFVALILIAGPIVVSRGGVYLIKRMLETGSAEYAEPVAIVVVAFAALLFVTVRFMRVYWRRNRIGSEVMIFKFRSSVDAAGYIVPPGVDRYEFAASILGKTPIDCSYVTYWQGGWLKPPGRFVRFVGGREYDQQCEIRSVGWQQTKDLPCQQLRVRDGFNNVMAMPAQELITNAELVDLGTFNLSVVMSGLRKMLDTLARISSPKIERQMLSN
jgi:hypothetical protein